MRVFVAGASGVLGRKLVPALLARGHEVVGLARSEEGAERVRRLGGEAVVGDVLDRDAVVRAVGAARPEAIVHVATAIPQKLDPKKIERDFAITNRLRSEGTEHLVSAAEAAGVRRVVAEGLAIAYVPGEGLADEGVPFLHDHGFAPNAIALERLEELVLGAGGSVLRFGYLYGDGTHYEPGADTYQAVRKRMLPLVGDAGGALSFIHTSDAADALVLAVEQARGGAFNVVDDDPAPPREWIPEYAREIGAKPPRKLPRFAVKVAAGPYAIHFLTAQRGASNAKAKAELGWQPTRASWRGHLSEH